MGGIIRDGLELKAITGKPTEQLTQVIVTKELKEDKVSTISQQKYLVKLKQN